MGCYDSIKFYCPDCGQVILAQSKSGPCTLDIYNFTEVPKDVAVDANRHAPFECGCGSKWYFESIHPKIISLEIKRLKENDEDN